MRIDKESEMTRGWFIGDFAPSVLRTSDFEVAIQRYEAGATETLHFHRIATEITAIVSGIASFNGMVVEEGDIVTILPEEAVEFKSISDVVAVVIKSPSVIGDKFFKEQGC